MNWLPFIGYALAPLALLIMVWLVGRPVSMWLDRRLPDGKLRKFLLFRWET